MSIFGWSTYDEWKTTEPVDWRDERDYCPECEHIWAKCKCEPEPEPPEEDCPNICPICEKVIGDEWDRCLCLYEGVAR